ncbi:hypothetical protein BSR29_08095 [Boudabousia liubingyangii]|uniref:Bax inhibitor-1/YccA family protein n=1 Tax=Boudabousia liubingyangii TaxID=1921764 RepID=A0A1Q5PJY3_9ACTO|nr:Bax inhibitor-1/YccA family protein [Boudabousia liubingyangii]OKL46198.1 hypothetical protein BSR29_08095 [Boudabousia liubingyangii]
MANPVLDKIAVGAEKASYARTPNGYPAMPGYTPQGQAAPQGSVDYAPQGDSGYGYGSTAYQQPQYQPQPYQTGQQPGFDMAYDRTGYGADAVTVDDVIVKTGLLLGLTVISAVVSWYLTLTSPQLGLMLGLGGALVALVLGFIIIFKSSTNPGLISTYMVAEGLMLGAVSLMFETEAPGVVGQALIATGVVFAVTLLLFRSGKVRNSSKVQKFALIGIIGILVLQVLDLILTMTGVIDNPWGLEGMTIAGFPLAGLLAVFVVLVGGASLIGDFDSVQRAAQAGLPKKSAWLLSFGIMLTVIWLYIQLLRYLAIIASSRD